MGRHFLGGLLIFSWGGGAGRESDRSRSERSVDGQHAISNSPILFYVIYCVEEVSLHYVFRPSRRGSSTSMPWSDT
jgi:hypothetical protein